VKTYSGYRRYTHGFGGKLVARDCVVTVHVDNGPGYAERSYPLAPRLDLKNHSPTGFEWSYLGSGPSQLALALVADCCGDRLAVPAVYQAVKAALVARLPHEGWTLTEQQITEAVSAAAREAGL
jgi:hypothetical protein